MRTKHITVDIAPDGAVKIDAHCFSGTSCEQATKFLEDALGTPGKKDHKPEYRQRESAQKAQVRQ